MDKNTSIGMLGLLNSNDPSDCEGDLNVLCDINVREVCKRCNINLENLCEVNENLYKFNKCDNSMIWNYVCLNFYLLNLLKECLDSTPSGDVLSVQHTKLLKNVFKNIVAIGVKCNLQPKMPTYRKLPTQYVEEVEPILNSYNRLTATTYGVITCLKCFKLRSVILSDSLKPILASLYQILYCPLKKPNGSNEKITSSFVMTRELYDRFMAEKDFFKKELEYLENSLLKTLYVRETMLLPESNSPAWFMKSISQNLNAVICSPRGIETVAWAMLDSLTDYDPNDKAKTWKILEVIGKLILNFHGKREFEDNICKQLINLLDIKDRNDKFIVPFENLYVLCVKKLFYLDESACKNSLLPAILNQITCFTNKGHKFSDRANVTDSIMRVIRMLYSCFAGNSAENLPIGLLTPSINVLVYFYIVTSHSSLSGLQDELQEILMKYVNENDNKNRFFDLFIFDIPSNEVNAFRNDISLERCDKDLIVKKSDFKSLININTRGEMLIKLCRCKHSLSISLFIYLLNVLTDQDKYFKTSARKDLLEVESEFVLDEVVQKKLVVYRLLSELAEDELVQNHIKGNPIDLIKYFEDVLNATLNSGIHKNDDSDSESFQTTFTLLMVLQALVMNSEKHDSFKGLLGVLKLLFKESTNVELRNLLKSIVEVLANEKSRKPKQQTKSEVEKAIDDVCDPLLPVRGHGLMVLAKLIETKDPEAMNRKSYILNIFQQNLKNDDSFIYLSAINGLAAMGYIFPDVVLNILTDEYSDFGKKEVEDGVELRMKLGEILVRITKTLGEMAPKYKSMLLNTFLVGAKDDDHLIRASSLSNLGEVCKVLGYKLGTIVTEVLVCVHAIITTDKAVETRRAAVTVIRQLLAGLEVETITFLKDHILEIYRTLKTIYRGDKDDIMRLHAQLALEELNENVKDFLRAGSRLEGEKTFVLPDRKDIVYKF